MRKNSTLGCDGVCLIPINIRRTQRSRCKGEVSTNVWRGRPPAAVAWTNTCGSGVLREELVRCLHVKPWAHCAARNLSDFETEPQKIHLFEKKTKKGKKERKKEKKRTGKKTGKERKTDNDDGKERRKNKSSWIVTSFQPHKVATGVTIVIRKRIRKNKKREFFF